MIITILSIMLYVLIAVLIAIMIKILALKNNAIRLHRNIDPAKLEEHTQKLIREFENVFGNELLMENKHIIELTLYTIEKTNYPARPGLEYDNNRPNISKLTT